MILSNHQEGSIPRPDYVPQADYENALKGLAKFNQDEAERRARFQEQVRSLNQQMTKSLIGLLGAERHAKWTAFKAALREESLKWPVEEKPSPKYSIGVRMQEFFKANEMPVEKMRAVALDWQKSYDKVMDEYRGSLGEKKNEKDVDMDNIVPKSNACTPEQYRYPWNAEQHGLSYALNGYRLEENHTINGQTGLISSEMHAIVTGGDDRDYVEATNHVQHGTWVHTGQGGILKAFILVESLKDQYRLQAFDEEWQWSHMSYSGRSDIMFHVIHPSVTGYQRAEMSKFRVYLNDEGHYHNYDRSFLDYGSHHWAIINSRGNVPPNQWVFVRFGSATSLNVHSDDYTLNARVHAAWNIKTIFILCNGG